MKPARRYSENEHMLLSYGSIIRNATSGRRYRVGKRLGAGGFGTVYRAYEVPGTRRSLGECCLKVAIDPTAWHREAYFGDLLKDVPDVIRVHESFAWMPCSAGRKPRYCLITEFAEGGDLAQYLKNNPRPWTEAHARREIIRLLRSVMLLHATGAVHRDITPTNVFVGSNETLKLGDFGIAAHPIGKNPVLADVFAVWFAPGDMLRTQGAIWSPADDVYHLGQLFAILLRGSAESKLTTHDVKKLSCTPATKAVIQRCIGKRRKRYPNAAKMLSALRRHHSQEASQDCERSLQGKRVVFTGRMSIRRVYAAQLVRAMGGIVQRNVNHRTDVLVVGDQSPHWKADSKGQKLLDVDRENELGNKIAVINESRFRVLTDTAAGK